VDERSTGLPGVSRQRPPLLGLRHHGPFDAFDRGESRRGIADPGARTRLVAYRGDRNVGGARCDIRILLPTIIRLQRTPTLTQAAVRTALARWVRLNYVRNTLTLVAWIAALKVLAKL